MAERGTFFEPQHRPACSQNYIENKARYLGIGNYNEEGFAFMEKGIPLKLAMFKRALTATGLKLIMGTDAGAGAHGQNAREIIYRVQVGGQPPMDAIVGATSLAAAGARPGGPHRRDRAGHGGRPDRGGRRSPGGHHGAAARGVRDEGRQGLQERRAGARSSMREFVRNLNRNLVSDDSD